MSETPQIHDDVEIVDNLSRDRFELWTTPDGGDREFVGFLGYHLREPGVYDLQHTIISEQFSRQGYARTLVTDVLDGLRERGQTFVTSCSYVERFIERFPQYRDLVAEQI